MSLFSQSGEPIVTGGNDLRMKISKSLLLLKTQVVAVKIQAKILHYKLALRPKKNINVQLFTLWKFDLTNQFSITVQLLDEDQAFNNPHIQTVTDVLGLMNRESFLGTYLIQPKSTSLICFRYMVPWAILRGQISATIEEIYCELSQQYTRYVLKAKLLDGNQEVRSSKVHVALLKLRHMRQEFEMRRTRRQKCTTCYNLNSTPIKIVEDAMKIIGCRIKLLDYMLSGQSPMGKDKVKRCRQVCERVQKEIAVFKKSQEDSLVNIATGIQINKVIRESFFCQGGFSEIYRGEYLVNFYPTINPHILPLNKMEEDNRLGCKVRQLVKKTLKKEHSKDSSFENELNFLRFIRNTKYSRISQYYLPTFVERNKDEGDGKVKYLFMEYYRNNIYEASNNWARVQPRLNIAMQIFESISFLVERGILHRDLKQLNILVDNKNNIKIIDFGSCCGAYKENPEPGSYAAIDNDLMATSGYYYPYSQLQSEYPYIARKLQKDEFNRCDTFDLFSAGTILNNLFYLDYQLNDSLIYNELIYLTNKCHEKNPEDRLKASEAQQYMFLICELLKALKTLEIKPVRKCSEDCNFTPLQEFVKE